MKLYFPITVDLYKTYPLAVMNVQQNNMGRGALVTLTAAGAVIVPDPKEALYVYAKKPDGTVVYNPCHVKENQIQIDYDEQMTVEPGMLQVELQMVDQDGDSITTPIFAVNVQPSNADYKKITSQDEFKALVDALAEVNEIKHTIQKGDPGEAATIKVGKVAASDPGSMPAVTNSGTAQAAILDFVLPRGEAGPRGPQGPAGTANASSVQYDGSKSGLKATNVQAAIDEQNDNIPVFQISTYTVNVATKYDYTIGYTTYIDLSLQSDFPRTDKLVATIPLGAIQKTDSNRVGIVGTRSGNLININASHAGEYDLKVLYIIKP